MDKIMEQIIMKIALKEQAHVHDNHECAGLPFCVACRASVLLNHGLDLKKAHKVILDAPVGKKYHLIEGGD